MKLLTRKQQDDMLRTIAACQIIATKHIQNIEAHEQVSRNLADMSFEIGGKKGAMKVYRTFAKYFSWEGESDE